jgi:hypothetical protein
LWPERAGIYCCERVTGGGLCQQTPLRTTIAPYSKLAFRAAKIHGAQSVRAKGWISKDYPARGAGLLPLPTAQ